MSPRKPPPQCATCRAPLLFVRIAAITLALDKEPVAEGGTVAAYRTAAGGWSARWLVKSDVPQSHEKRYARHQCPKPPGPEPPPALFDIADLTSPRQ